MEVNSTGYFSHLPMSLNTSCKSQEKKLNAHNEKEEDRKKISTIEHDSLGHPIHSGKTRNAQTKPRDFHDS